MRKQEGLSWVESLMAIAVLGIVSAIAVPKLVGINDSLTNKAKAQAVDAVKTAFAHVIAEEQRYPEVVELVEYVDADGAKAVENGIQVRINEQPYVVLTYSDINCRSTDYTARTNDVVRCIGDIIQ